MPRNPFQARQPNRNPLLALLQQQEQPSTPPVRLPEGGPPDLEPQEPTAPVPGEKEALMKALLDMGKGGPGDLRAQLGARMPAATQQIGPKPLAMSSVAPDADSFAGNAIGAIFGDEAKSAINPVLGLPVKDERESASRSPVPQQQAPTPQGQGEPSFLQRLDAQDRPWKAGELGEDQAAQMQGFGQFVPPGINEAVQDSVRQYGIAQDDYEKATLALKKEFEGTPEIDQALSNAQRALDDARMQRKQPSAWDYIAMALMNLSGVPPQTSAAMVLGLDDQAHREEMLEGRVMGLQDAQVHGRMQGRRDFRSMQAQQGMAQMEAERRAQEMAQRQANLDREFGFKQQDQMADLLRSLAGQESETERTSMDEATRKKSAASRDLMKKLLQLDDPSLQRMLQQRQQTQPKDQRQSRMFGSLIGDQFA